MATVYASSTVRPAAIRQSARTSSRKLSVGLWIVQGLLALVFVMTGSMKLLMPADMLAAQSPLPIEIDRFIGLCEVAGALGLLLPGILRIRTGLTPLAAACLVVLMICATILTPIMISPDPTMLLMPATVGVLAAFVCYARLCLAPLRGR